METKALKIPGWKSEQELEFAANLCKELKNSNSCRECKPYNMVVEIGASAGRLTWVLSENVPKHTLIYAVDSWCGTKRFVGNGYELDPNETNTLEYFDKFMEDRPVNNVISLKTDSLTFDWINQPIDLIFIDPDDGHGTDLKSHLEHWHSYVRKGGIIAGYNFYEHRDDVREQLVEFSEKFNKELLVDVSRGWKFLK